MIEYSYILVGDHQLFTSPSINLPSSYNFCLHLQIFSFYLLPVYTITPNILALTKHSTHETNVAPTSFSHSRTPSHGR